MAKVEAVADTAPLNYLVLIEAADILPELFAAILIPETVRTELSHPKAPDAVRLWIAAPPSWLQMEQANTNPDAALSDLHIGERDAISIALERNATLLIDERDGVAIAQRLGLRVIGTLSLLEQAANRGWLDLDTMFNRLRATSFRAPITLMAAMLEEYKQRRK